MAETQNGQSAEHLTIPSDSTIEGLFQDGVTVENGVRAEITGRIVGLIALREGSRLTIHGQAVGQLQIDVGAELTLVGLYAGTLAQSFDGALFASQGSTINRRVFGLPPEVGPRVMRAAVSSMGTDFSILSRAAVPER